MNGRKAKALRNVARAMTVGLPYRSYIQVPQERSEFGAPPGIGIQLGDCTRRAYRELKRRA